MTQHFLPHTVIWRGLDHEGMDICTFDRSTDGYSVEGTALFKADNGPARIVYRLDCDEAWRSKSASVEGQVGPDRIFFVLSHTDGDEWSMGGKPVSGVNGLPDVDLGFTPATNTNALKRLSMDVGATVETTAVWLDTEDWRFKPLRQIYHRRSTGIYAYSSPVHDYNADLEVDAFGVIRNYPQLWQAI